MKKFNATILPENASIADMKMMIQDWEVLLVTVLDEIIARYQRNTNYPYIDTKLNIITGKDFEPLPNQQIDFKSKCSVFGWIQGRGLESLVGHAKWVNRSSVLSSEEKIVRVESLNKMINEIFIQLEKVRKQNNGHLFFTFTPEGTFFKIDDAGIKETFKLTEDNSLMSDLFYVKGMIEAAVFLKDINKIEEAKDFFKKILSDINDNKFKGDQVSFDPKNKVKAIPGSKGHGSRMIALGGIAVFAGHFTQEPFWFEKGCEYIQYIMNNHVNYKDQLPLEKYDFIEKITLQGAPFLEDRGYLADPGHALEFIGLACKFLIIMKQKGNLTVVEEETLIMAEQHFCPLLSHCFDYGYGENGGGIIKAFDLKSRQAINDDMPWWNLPETIRACAGLIYLFPNHSLIEKVKKVLVICSNCYFNNYINHKVHLMAYQTIDKNCKPVDIIPATPDADPGYHTNLSIIDFLGCIKK